MPDVSVIVDPLFTITVVITGGSNTVTSVETSSIAVQITDGPPGPPGSLIGSTETMSTSGDLTSDATKFVGSIQGQTLVLPSPGEILRLVRNASTVPVTIDASSNGGTVEGDNTMVIFPGESVMLVCIVTDWTVF